MRCWLCPSSKRSSSSFSPAALLSAELREAEAKESNDPSAALGVHARRVEALRKRLEGVAYTMSRVQLRLDGLTSVVTKAEDKKRKERSAAASAS